MTVIWVEGIISAGKTTFTKEAAKFLNLRPVLEPVEDNALLDDYYAELKATGKAEKYGFPMQMWLMARRHAMQQLAAWESHYAQYAGSIIDRGLPGDRVFAKMLAQSGSMDPKFWDVYEYFYDVMSLNLPTPSLLVFLDVDPQTAYDRKLSRGRACEESVPLDYFKRLHRGYMDLLSEIKSGAHRWARGIQVMNVPWNADFQDPVPIFREMAHICRLRPSPTQV